MPKLKPLWHIVPYDRQPCSSSRFAIEDSKGKLIGIAYDRPDARLIASAPLLLSAVEAAVQLIVDRKKWNKTFHAGRTYVLARLNAAINAAESDAENEDATPPSERK